MSQFGHARRWSTDRTVGHLLCWEQHERDGSWHAWISWVYTKGTRHDHEITCMEARWLTPVEAPEAYTEVPRRMRGYDGQIRPFPRSESRAAP